MPRKTTNKIAALLVGLRLCSMLLTLSKVVGNLKKEDEEGERKKHRERERERYKLYIYIGEEIKRVMKKDTSNLPRATWAQRKLTLKRITARLLPLCSPAHPLSLFHFFFCRRLGTFNVALGAALPRPWHAACS